MMDGEYGYDHYDAHDYGECKPERDEPDDWYAEESADYLDREVFEPLREAMRP
ncbi:MAG: hypothetical protein IIZ12_05980 [Eggerthellaceae bacterium]|nr:hypothetical protein [Eggerthellaceae bacterium]